MVSASSCAASSARVFAVIVTYNGMKWLEKTFQCLAASSVPVEVVVVDNGSSDGTREFVSKETIHFLPQKENLGFGAANNIGIEYALAQDATHVLLVNQDAYVAADMLERLLACESSRISAGQPLALLSPIHWNGDHSALDLNFSKNSYKRGAVDLTPRAACSGVGSGVAVEAEAEQGVICAEPYEVKFVNAALWLLPAELIRAVGYFSPAFFHYGEDQNYCNRVRFHGFGLVVVPGAEVRHDRGKYGNPRLAAKSQIPNKLVNIYLDPNIGPLTRLAQYLLTLGESLKKGCPGAYLKGLHRLLTDKSLPTLRRQQ